MTSAKRNELRRRDEAEKRRKKEERTGIPVPPKKKHAKNTRKKG